MIFRSQAAYARLTSTDEKKVSIETNYVPSKDCNRDETYHSTSSIMTLKKTHFAIA